MNEETDDHIDGLGSRISSPYTSLGRLDVGPKLTGPLGAPGEGDQEQAFILLTGVWDFDTAETVDVATSIETGSTDGLRGRLGGVVQLDFAHQSAPPPGGVRAGAR